MVGISGGVDSAVSALLLKQQGYAVSGLFMKNWDDDDDQDYCPAAQDLADAEAVCDAIAVELHKKNFSAEYWARVFKHFLAEYAAGRTPNPDILCNSEIKFEVFRHCAHDLGADFIATGHYARRRVTAGQVELLRGCDQSKDQSYFLYALTQDQLARALFPVGELEKSAVRRMAAEVQFVNRDKKDSTGICFIGERKFSEFLARYLPAQPGDMRTPDGILMGQHSGLMYYTLGQRHGLNIGGTRASSGEPWYVVGKDMRENVLMIAQGHDHPLLYSASLVATTLNWIAGHAPETAFRCTAKTRYRQADQACQVETLSPTQVRVTFDAPQRAVTPGQSVVFYDGEVCLGGGVIESSAGIQGA